jgi:CRISPR-associated endonuclease/helicase Cas3
MAAYHDFWAKTDRAADAEVPPYHLLPYHNLDVAAAARVLLERDDLVRGRLARLLGLDEPAARDLLVFLTALHDTGKFAEGFQNCAPALFEKLRGRSSNAAYTVRHDTLGFVAWQSIVWGTTWAEDWFSLREHTDERYDAQEYFEPLMRAVAGHHGAPPELSRKTQHPDLHFDDEAQEALLDFARRCRFLLPENPPFQTWSVEGDVPRAKRASWLAAGLTVLADWIGSNSDFFAYRQGEIALETYWRDHALPQAEDAVEQTGVLASPVAAETGPQVLFPDLFPRRDPTPLQAHAASCDLGDGPQLFMLEDLTGSGKTEAALLLAHRLMAEGRAAGLYVALPTMATADAMYERVGDAYRRLYDRPETASLVLARSAREHAPAFRQSIEIDDAHARASETYDGAEQTGRARCTAWLADSRKKALLASVGVGTIDQALIGILPARHQSLRLAGLSRSLLVVDEVHACDAYMQRLLQRLLAFHAAQGGSALLLSATLPQRMRNELADAFRSGLREEPASLDKNDFPLVTRIGASGNNEQPVAAKPGSAREIGVQPFHDEEAVADHLAGEAKTGRCACWIRNTVGDARQAYRALCKRLDAERVTLFHARFALCDRQAVEERVLAHFGNDSGPEERNGRVVVATQVIEQSLDLDFDAMVTDLAPVDLLIQRAGRMHRHPRTERGARKRAAGGPDEREPPALGVLTPPLTNEPSADWYRRLFPGGAYVYPEVDVLWRTAQVLDDYGGFALPKNARALVERVYGEDAAPVPDAIARAAQEAKSQTRIDLSLADSNALTLDEGYGNPTDSAHWRSDERTPTRLGEETTTVRLGRRKNGRVAPWAAADEDNDDDRAHPWPRSQVNVRAAKIAGSDHSNIDAGAVAAAQNAMPDNGQWSTLVVLRGPRENDRGDATWTGAARDADGDPVRVAYSETTGLHVHPAH